MTNHDTSSPCGESLVFLLDVDNTLLNNDQLKQDLAVKIRELLGPQRAERFWQLYEQVRQEHDYVDYPATVEAMVDEYHDPDIARRLNQVLYSWPFENYLYPDVMATIAHLETLGTVVILSDGDSVFQPLKIRRSGLEAAVHDNVLVYVHKELELQDVFNRYPADCYVIVDDKPRILDALERECPSTFITILVLQGKYAARLAQYKRRPDYVVARIGDLQHFGCQDFTQPAPAETASHSSPLQSG